MRLAILSCGAAKKTEPSEARELYTGSLFRAARRHIEDRSIPYRILSAKHGLVSPSHVLAPYDLNMQQRLKRPGRRQWFAGFAEGIDEWCLAMGATTLEVHAGKAYVDTVRNAIAHLEREITITTPLKGLQIGQRLSWYKTRRSAE